jgi:hypothetical protein
MDFGAADPTACLFGAWNPREARAEFYQAYEATDLLAKEHAKTLAPLFIEYGVHWVAYDGHARQAKNELDEVFRKEYGLSLEWISCMEDVEKGVRDNTKDLRTGGLAVNRKGCEPFCDELETYKRDKNGAPEARGPNHLCDSWRYWKKALAVLREQGVIQDGPAVHVAPQYVLKPGEEHIDHSWMKEYQFRIEDPDTEVFVQDFM